MFKAKKQMINMSFVYNQNAAYGDKLLMLNGYGNFQDI